MNKFIQLQSGFIAKDETKFRLPVKQKDFYKDNVIGKDYLDDKNDYFYHEGITDLYDKYNQDNSLKDNMEFRELVIKAIKEAIDEKSFFKWLNMQVQYAKFSKLHTTFIYDTLNFLSNYVENNKVFPREVSIAQWIKLIEYSPEVKAVQINIDTFFNKEVKDSINYLPSSLTDIMTIWMSKPDGFEDMLITMYIVFGERRYINNVSNKLY